MARARRPIAAGNWKMHLLRAEAEAYCRALAEGLGASPAGGPRPEVVLFPSFPLLPAVAAALAGTGVEAGAQDLHPEPRGAHTGDVSAAQLLDAGARFTLAGHSERRRDHGESDERVAAKARAALAAGLVPVVCVGETADERRRGETLEVLGRQLAPLPLEPALVLAYEPVWAIGTGATATPAIAQEAHAHLRGALAGRGGAGLAASTRILYGGSVSPENAAELAAAPDVDGFLVGGASLDPGRFLAIIHVLGG